MIKIYNVNQASSWDDVVRSFDRYDVYYLSGYVKSFELHGDGKPELLYYENGDLRAIYVYMKRKTFLDGIYDSISPYGYGGIIFEGNKSLDNLQLFWREYVAKMNEMDIVCNFVRYHPVLANAVPMKEISDVLDLGKTIAIDLSSPEIIWDNISSKNRNVIRKAEKNNIEILHSNDVNLFREFLVIYNATMDRDNADAYYYFNENFYQSIYSDLQQNFEMFYATYQEKIIAMSIVLYANKQMHYHLSGSLVEYRHLAPSNLLLYKAALWGCEQGFCTFHLGGGVGSGEDSLYKFKAAFNRKSDYQFSIGRHIFDMEKYNQLSDLASQLDPQFDSESNFFPIYRQNKHN